MSIDVAALRRAGRTYRDAPLMSRAWVVARYVVAPLGPLTEEAGQLKGRVLSLGPGLCMLERYLLEVNPDLEIHGVDLDARRIEIINATRSRSPRLTIELGDATELDAPCTYDGVLVCDAFHHFPIETHEHLARAIAESLKPGGVCVIKDLDDAPAWKREWNRLHDRLAAGPDPIHCRPPAEMAALFTAAGLVVEREERTDHLLTPYAHYILRLRKPVPDDA